MRKLYIYVLAFFVVIEAVSGVSAFANCSFTDLVEKSVPAIVNISTSQKTKKKSAGDAEDYYEELRDLFSREFGLTPHGNGSKQNGESTPKALSLGSGVIIEKDGVVITNNHVIDGADEIMVTIGGENGEQYKAKVIGKDPVTDIAILKINAGRSLPFLTLGDSDQAKVGESILVIGNPFGLGVSVSAGIISAKARNLNSGHFDDFIQTDAAINVGNSGGPMISCAGEVIGINSIILSPSKGSIGIGFAIPSNMIKPVVKQLKEKGEVIRGRIGITIQLIDHNLAEGLGLKNVKGALVSSVMKNSSAERAGIKIGDVITKVGDQVITTHSLLPRIIGEATLNEVVTVEVLRDGKILRLPVKVEKPAEEKPVANIAKKTDTVFGIKVQDIDKEAVQQFSIKDHAKGVVITEVQSSSVAAMSGIRAGDVILSVNKHEVNSLKQFESLTAEIKKSGKGSVTLLITRNGLNFFTSLVVQ